MPQELYRDLLMTIRSRLDIVRSLRSASLDEFTKAETAAFHGRKIVEGIAFACLIATENGLGHVPRNAKGQWNAESIINSLRSKKLTVFPSPSIIRTPTTEERSQYNVTAVVEGVPDHRLTEDELIEIYQRLHKWLHEINPYKQMDHSAFVNAHSAKLWDDICRLEAFIERHAITIRGEGFFCVLRDTHDGKTKVGSISKTLDL